MGAVVGVLVLRVLKSVQRMLFSMCGEEIVLVQEDDDFVVGGVGDIFTDQF